MSGTGDEPWESYYLQLDGRLTSVAVHLGLHARAPVAELPILTRITVPVVGSDAHFFTPDEGDFLDRMVAGLETLVGRRGGLRTWFGPPANELLFVGRRSHEGEAFLYFHSRRRIEKARLVELERLLPRRAWSCEDREDALWRTYLDTLHPGPALNPLLASWALIDEHRKEGSDPAVKRPVDHTLLFQAEDGRRGFLEEARPDQQTQVRPFEMDGTDATHRFGVDLTWEHTLFRSVVDPHVVGLARRAARFGGVYDGWGCPVVGSDGR